MVELDFDYQLEEQDFFTSEDKFIERELRIRENIEEHYIHEGYYELWRVQIAEDLETGTSYWHYIGKVDDF